MVPLMKLKSSEESISHHDPKMKPKKYVPLKNVKT